jgi:hypothetical protein
MRYMRSVRLLLTGVVFALVFLSLSPAGASSANISHSYHASGSVSNGSLVSLDPLESDHVQPANTDNGSRLLGVTVAGNDSLIAVDATPGLVQIATSGSASALVSTVNGDIAVGDQIGVSPFDGIGMKALPGSRVIGLAQTAFNSHTSGKITRQVTDKQGKTSSISVGYVRVSIAIGTYAGGTDVANLSPLQRFARSITGHVVSTPRVALSVAIAIIAILALVTLIYASIYGSIISIGRNPLAKYAVFRSLASVVGLALITAGIAGVTIFFLLR